ncbi:hypothetical protein DV735_g1723, partial [Chaetothyriales sp. CBS 134920]
MITGLHHVNLLVPSGTLDLANQFYGTVLGLKPRPVPSSQAHRVAWYDIADSGQQVHIAIGDSVELDSSRHPCFKIGSLEALLELQKRIWAHYEQGGQSAPKAADKPGEQNSGSQGYTNRKSRHQKPTAHISYDEGLHLVRSFLNYASHKTIDDLQSFTANIVPHGPWVHTENVSIPPNFLTSSAEAIIANLGEDGIGQVGGRKWWQWRRNASPLKAEWIEMRADHQERRRTNAKSDRVMLYVHGGAYFFGSVDEHRYQMQRHARKLKARVIAPRYRLAPQFPFPCGLHDCLAVYLYVLATHQASEIVLAGDSAGGGMILAIMCVLRDQNLPLPAGAVLISPWVDLTHSFPSSAAENPLDYIPPQGFHHKPSTSWPPPNEDEMKGLNKNKPGEGSVPVEGINEESGADPVPRQHHQLSVEDNGVVIQLKDQTQMYTTNQLLSHPLVSPVLQPSLGGLPPLLVLTGGGELIRDEQIYLAHKAADPQSYPLGPQYRGRYDPGDEILNKYKPTPVQLQVWEDLCHAAPALSFTRPAKYMYRSIAQFGAWALARAQDRPIEIVDDDNISVISSRTSSSSRERSHGRPRKERIPDPAAVGKAGDPLPVFKNHMIRQQVDRHGNISPLPPASELTATRMGPSEVGIVKAGPVKKWLAAKHQFDTRYAGRKHKVHKQLLQQLAKGNALGFGDGEYPPPSALARRRTAEDELPPKAKKSYGLAMWSGWGSKHDEQTVKREEEIVGYEGASSKANDEKAPRDGGQHEHEHEPLATASQSIRRLSKSLAVRDGGASRSRSRSTTKGATLGAEEAPTRMRKVSVTDQANNSLFAPKSKPSAPPSPRHRRGDSKTLDSEDAASALSDYTIPSLSDHASTMAIFSAPGVAREAPTPNSPSYSYPQPQPARGQHSPAAVPAAPSLPDFDTNNTDTHTTTAAAAAAAAHGSDTPASRRSLERLQTSNYLTTTLGGSASASASAAATDDGDGPSASFKGRPAELVRNASTTAVLLVEGVAPFVHGPGHGGG